VRKINALYEIAHKNQHEEMKSFGIAMRYGMNADAKDFEKWLKG
jgi:hypothetical protein